MRRYSLAKRPEFARRLGDSWKDLADDLDIPISDRRGFEAGGEARGIWDWLAVRGILGRLPAALTRIDRADLAALFVGPVRAPVHRRRILVVAGIAVVMVVAAVAAVWTGEPGAETGVLSSPTPATATRTGGGIATTATDSPPLTASLKADPDRGPAGTRVRLDGSGFVRGEPVRIEIVEGSGLRDFRGPYFKVDRTANADGQIRELWITVDSEICCAGATVLIRASGLDSFRRAERLFTLR